MKYKELNSFELKALRQGLSLTVAEAAEIIGVSKRAFQYWETGRYDIPQECIDACWWLNVQYDLFIRLLDEDIKQWKLKNPTLQTDDVEEYKKWVKSRDRLCLPFFSSFESYLKVAGFESIPQWRIYQSAISHFFSIGKIEALNDQCQIPEDFKIMGALRGDFDFKNER